MSAFSANGQEAVSTNQLCEMLGLSRRRFLELRQRGVFPQPTAYAMQSRRPVYFPEIVHQCLEVRRRNMGINSEIIFFHVRSAGPVSRRTATTRTRRAQATRPASCSPQAAGLVAALAALGVATNGGAVDQMIHELFPTGTATADEGTLLRAVYQQIRMRNRGDNQGR
jgi:hypothetical protein